MPALVIIKPFKFAHGGIHVEEFLPGAEPQELTDECATVALAEGWAKPKRGRPPAPPAATPAVAPDAEATDSADAGTQPDLVDSADTQA